MTILKTQIKSKRGRPPLSAAKRIQRSKVAQATRTRHKALRAKIALIKADFREKLKVVAQEAYKKALERVVKLERKKMEASYKALAVAQAKLKKKKSKRISVTKSSARPQFSLHKMGMDIHKRRRGRPRKIK